MEEERLNHLYKLINIFLNLLFEFGYSISDVKTCIKTYEETYEEIPEIVVD